jgi:hypothetical protein
VTIDVGKLRVNPKTIRHFALKAAPFAFLALALSACNSTTPLQTSTPSIAPASQAMVILPPGSGAILGVVETTYVNGIEQYVTLDTHSRMPGQNFVSIQALTTKALSAPPGGLQDIPLAELDMAGEARGTVSFADMKLSPYFVQNSYGPFGYSVGTTATGDICIYAWQRISPELFPSGVAKRGAISLRLQMCDERKTEQELLDVMLQLRIKGVTGIARRGPAGIGSYGLIIAPVGLKGPANVLKAAPTPVPVQAAPRVKAAPTIVEDAPGPVPDVPTTTVPSPGDVLVPTVPTEKPPIVPSPGVSSVAP